MKVEQFRILELIGDKEFTIDELAAEKKTSRQSIYPMLVGMEEFVEKIDRERTYVRKAKVVRLTKKGKKALEEITEGMLSTE